MTKPTAPCLRLGKCPDRNENCHNETCPHGWVEYESALKEYRHYKSIEFETNLMISDYDKKHIFRKAKPSGY